MQYLQSNKLFIFLKKNPLFVFAFFLAFFFLLMVILSITSASKKDPKQQPATSPTSKVTADSTGSGLDIKEDDEEKHIWTPRNFSNTALVGKNANELQLKDGSTQYSYIAVNPNRPNMVIVKNGIYVLQRQSIYKTTVKNYMAFLKKPDNAILGSGFYGNTTVTYVFPSRGISILADVNTGFVVEQSVFQPISINEYKQKYADSPKIPGGEQKKESFNNGTIKYTYVSSVPDRPNIITTKNATGIIFQRIVKSSSVSSLSDLLKNYGPAPWVFKGSKTYGTDAQSYIYPELGVAFIADNKTNQVFEQQLFVPTKVEDYVSKYGDDIPAQP